MDIHIQTFARIFISIKFDLIQLNVISSSKLQINTTEHTILHKNK